MALASKLCATLSAHAKSLFFASSSSRSAVRPAVSNVQNYSVINNNNCRPTHQYFFTIHRRHYSPRILRKEEHSNAAEPRTIQTVTQIFDSVVTNQRTKEGDKSAHCKWKPTSPALLEEAENRIFSRLRQPYKGRYVDIGPVVGSKDCKVWTIGMNEESRAVPLVLLHGFGAAAGFWSLNLEAFAQARPVYAIDLLGFGKSSRPKFSTNPSEAEHQFVQSIEAWREQMRVEKFVLVGHSFGGFLATSYALQFPTRVSHLVLADPWGFTEKPEKIFTKLPFWAKAIGMMLRNFNPFAIIRVAGPYGKRMVERARPNLFQKFSALNNEEGDLEDVRFAEYVYHCNAQPPAGETAFHSMMTDYGWAKSPMIRRLHGLSPSIDLTAIYGSHSWIRGLPLPILQRLRNNLSAFTNVEIIEGAGHHVYSDGKDEFNRLVLKASLMADRK